MLLICGMVLFKGNVNCILAHYQQCDKKNEHIQIKVFSLHRQQTVSGRQPSEVAGCYAKCSHTMSSAQRPQSVHMAKR